MYPHDRASRVAVHRRIITIITNLPETTNVALCVPNEGSALLWCSIRNV